MRNTHFVYESKHTIWETLLKKTRRQTVLELVYREAQLCTHMYISLGAFGVSNDKIYIHKQNQHSLVVI